MVKFSTLEQSEISRAFSRGNYANAYESESLEDFDLDSMRSHERSAWILGFFACYSLDEIGSDREVFDEAYWSEAGQYAVNVAKYIDSRAEEYAEEESAYHAEGGV